MIATTTPTNGQYLTQKELTFRWQRASGQPCSIRTVGRIVRKFRLMPAKFDGNVSLYALADVERAERDREQHRYAVLGYTQKTGRLMTLKELQRAAKRGGNRRASK